MKNAIFALYWVKWFSLYEEWRLQNKVSFQWGTVNQTLYYWLVPEGIHYVLYVRN